MIKGVVLTPIKQIIDERGKVMHMLSIRSPVYQKFGEIYFSCIHPGIIKGWHLHKKMTLNYAVPFGKIKLVLFDGRAKSSTKGEIMVIYLSPDNYQLVTIPPGIWNGFKGLGEQTSIVANCSTIPHSPDEILRVDPFENSIPYNWKLAPDR